MPYNVEIYYYIFLPTLYTLVNRERRSKHAQFYIVFNYFQLWKLLSLLDKEEVHENYER